MALQLPGYSVPQGYGPAPNLLELFKSGYDFGGGISDEQGAQKALGDYVASLYMGKPKGSTPEAAPFDLTQSADPGNRLIGAESMSAEGATDPKLALAMAKKGIGDAQSRALNFFIGKGYSPAQAAGIVGNLMHESGMSTGALNAGDGADGSNSIGIAQWNGPRAQALQAYAAQNGGDANDLMTQLGFVDSELNGPEAATKAALLKAQNPVDATKAFIGYERPQGWTPETPTAGLGFGNRARLAAQLAGSSSMAPAATPTAAQPGGDAAGTGGLPSRDVLAALFQNPITRSFAADLVKTTRTAGKPTDLQSNYLLALQQGYQGSIVDYQKDIKGTGVTVNTGDNSSKFSNKADELAAGRMNDYVSAGNDAANFTGDIQALADLGKNITTGKSAQFIAALGPYAEALGVKIDGLDDAQAYDAIISRMAPQMRQPGSGASSDFDARQFLKSLPSLGNTPEGNQIIQDVFTGLQQRKMEAAAIANRALSGEISWQAADKQIAALGNPYAAFKAFQKSQGGGSLTRLDDNAEVDDLVKKYSK